MHFGIDYGSKLAGTTVITYDKEKTLYQISSRKKEDADALILNAVKELKPTGVYIDAPLSLPLAYFGRGKDYFYREADKELKAMSPMFLGGLTARAMRLKSEINVLGIEVFETYPGAFIRSVPELDLIYNKKDKSNIVALLEVFRPMLKEVKLHNKPDNLHQFDSLLAWYSGYRHKNDQAQKIGNQEEGVIVF
ncbi:MAG: hypothetical protein AAGA77_17730 [Bacteroidota bacterium]